MSVDRALLAQYLRQLRELGVDDVFLDSLTTTEAVALAGGAGSAPAVGAAAATGQAGVVGRLAAMAGIEAPAAVAARTRSPAAARVGAGADSRADVTAVAPAAHGPLVELGRDAGGCTRCRLHTERTHVVFGEGDPAADVVVVGEAPGQEEDRTGRPFVGRAGKLLDLLLMSVGFPRESVYICNTLKCRPPNNRNPLPDEVEACAGFLRGQLDAIAPKVLLAVGKFAAQSLLGTEESIGRLRGVVHEHRGSPLIVTYHPAYLLRSPQMTRIAWQDFQLLRRVLDEQA